MGTHREHKHRHSSPHKHSKRHSSHGEGKHKHHHHSHKKHHHSHHHHHHKKKKKSHHHHHKKEELIELQLDDKVLQNALDCLEAGALGVIKNGDTLSSEALSVLANDAISDAKWMKAREEESEDSESDSSDDSSEGEEEEERRGAKHGERRGKEEGEEERVKKGEGSTVVIAEGQDARKNDKNAGSAHEKVSIGSVKHAIKTEGIKSCDGNNVVARKDVAKSSSLQQTAQTEAKKSNKEPATSTKLDADNNSKILTSKPDSGKADKLPASAGGMDEAQSSNSSRRSPTKAESSAADAGAAKRRSSGGNVVSEVKKTPGDIQRAEMNRGVAGPPTSSGVGDERGGGDKGRENKSSGLSTSAGAVKKHDGTSTSKVVVSSSKEKMNSMQGKDMPITPSKVDVGSKKPAVSTPRQAAACDDKNIKNQSDTKRPGSESSSSQRRASSDRTRQSHSDGKPVDSSTSQKREAKSQHVAPPPSSSNKLDINYSSTDTDSDSSRERDSSCNEEQDESKRKPVNTKKFGQKSSITININKSSVGKTDEKANEELSSGKTMSRSGMSKVTYVNLKPAAVQGRARKGAESESVKGDGQAGSSKLDSGRRSRSRSKERSSRRRNSSDAKYRSRSRSKSISRRRSRSRSRRHRSRSRSRSRRRRSGSYSKGRRSRSFDRHRRKRSRSPYSLNRGSSRRRSRTRSTSYSSRSHSRSKSPTTATSSKRRKKKKRKAEPKPSEVMDSIPNIAKGLTRKTKQNTISQLTDFCKDLQKRQEIENVLGPDAVQEQVVEQAYRTPYMVNPTVAYQPGLVYHNNTWKTANQMVAETNMLAQLRPLTDQFPVSTGLEHKTSGVEEEDVKGVASASGGSVFSQQSQAVDISDVAIKRVLASERLKANPTDIEAINILVDVEQKTQVWAKSKIVPGKFTGHQSLTALTKQDHKTGLQAWAKKNMFRDLAPVMSGFGMKMMQKMGWSVGQPLGKEGVGHVEPIPVEVKTDRTGLSTEMDKLHAIVKPLPPPPLSATPTPAEPKILHAPTLQSADARSAHLVQGKHPVSALQEICSKKRWDSPKYTLVLCEGPAHLKTFIYEVTVPLGTFRAANASKNKKQAKMEAATAALQGLGLIKKT